VALQLGFSRTDATFVATAISEIARNITAHAGSGEITIASISENGRDGMVVIARDDGPGIADVPAVMRRAFAPAWARHRPVGRSATDGRSRDRVGAWARHHGDDEEVVSLDALGRLLEE
jgi:hypothetical protein